MKGFISYYFIVSWLFFCTGCFLGTVETLCEGIVVLVVFDSGLGGGFIGASAEAFAWLFVNAF